MLRNLVTSLLQHEQIKTTIPKAKEAARLADKMITLGKKGDLNARREAEAFLLDRSLLTTLFEKYAERYAQRPGGYTRIHKYGHREGDHAPHAILELVDGPRDLKFEMTARAVGKETLARYLHHGEFRNGDGLKDALEKEEGRNWLRERTKWNLEKVLKYRSPQALEEFQNKAVNWANKLIAEPQAHDGLRRTIAIQPADDDKDGVERLKPVGRRQMAGERLSGMSVSASGLGIAKGALGKQKVRRSKFWEGGWKDISKGKQERSLDS